MPEIVLTASEAPADPPLPALREDLGLFPGPRNSRGEASWTLHDPVRNRYFRLGEREFELLTRWRQAPGTASLAVLAAHDGIAATRADVEALVEFLHRCELTQDPVMTSRRLSAAHTVRQQSLWQQVMHNYLSFRIPLVRPDPLLDRWYPRIRPLLSRRFAQVTVLAGLLGLFLVIRQWDIFTSTFLAFMSLEGAAAFAFTLAIVKVLHEGGHAIACRHFGLRVPSIGVVFIVMWPVMYTDASEAWRLTSRRARVTIAAAGMLTELTIACYATLLWVLLPDGLLRSMVFTLATTTWIMSLVVNLNPMMKFDGYYLFSDIFDIPNLQERGFELARNRLRHLLFGVPLVSDPGLDAREHRIAVVWAYATWIYRFIVFLGIALLVYAFFFKALGIVLFLVEIWYFIAAPIWRETRNWRALASAMDVRQKRAWLMGGGALLLVLLVPWESSFTAPATMKSAELQRIYAAEPSQVTGVFVGNGSRVHPGDVMFELSSPSLDAQMASALAELRAAEYDLARILSSVDTSQDRLLAEESLARAQAEYAGLEQRREKQRVVAPYAGVVSDMPTSLKPGLWVDDRQTLAVLVGTGGGVVADGYVFEEHLRFIQPGDPARFYPEEPGLPPRDGVVERVDTVDTRSLKEPYLAGVFGGDIDVRMDGDQNAVPETAVYQVRIRLDAQVADVPLRVVRGHLRLGGDDRSLAGRLWTFTAGVLRRESGF